jgi:hypothetical protein
MLVYWITQINICVVRTVISVQGLYYLGQLLLSITGKMRGINQDTHDIVKLVQESGS